MTNIEQERALPALPSPDTHCFDDDTQTDCWSHSPEQMREYGRQCAEQARAQQPSAGDGAKLPATLQTAGGKRIVSLALLPDALRNSRPNREDCNDAADVIEQLIAMAAHPAADVLADAELYRELYAAAKGLSFGEDWNNGTHAKLHGFRKKLIDAVAAIDAARAKGE